MWKSRVVGRLGVQDEADGELALVLLLPHHTRDVVAVAELVAEPVAVGVEQEMPPSPRRASAARNFHLEPGSLGSTRPVGVNLDLVHVDAVSADGHDHLLAVAGGVRAVGGGQAEGVGAVLLEERAVAEVGGVAAGGEDDGAVERLGLAVELVCDAGDGVALLVEAGDPGLLDDLNTLGLGLGELLEPLHQGVGDGHAGGTWHRGRGGFGAGSGHCGIA